MCSDAAASLLNQSYHKMCWSMKYVGLQNVAEWKYNVAERKKYPNFDHQIN